jgi:hypothetical protein
VHLLDMTNLIPKLQPKIAGTKGDSFDRALARRAATRIYTRAVSDGREVLILAGKGVGQCFLPDKKPLEYYKTYWGIASMRIFVIPHPSGINHYWNNPSNVDAASKILRAIVFGWPMSHPSLRNTNAQR